MAMNPRLLRPLATGFSPRQIAGLRVWLDPSKASSVTLDTGISQINDLSGNGYHATQSVGADQPTYSDTQNGLGVMTFDGTSQSLQFASGAILDIPVTVFVVLLSPVSAGATRYIIARQSSGNNGGVLIRQESTDFTSQLIDAASPFPTAAVTRGTGWGILEATLTAAQAEIARNASVVDVAAGISGFANDSSFAARIGRRPDNAQEYWDSQIGEILVYGKELAASEVAKCEGYLAWKWGLQAQLPYDHPYARSFPGFGSQTVPTDADTLTYLAAVAAADGTGVEVGVANAVDAFVTGCKSDGIWDAIQASCILAGARTLAGALVPLKGTAPTNNNFTASDYNRETGLVGDGSTTYLDTNRANDDDPQDDNHNALYISTANTASPAVLMGSGGNVDVGKNRFTFLTGDFNFDSRSGNSQPETIDTVSPAGFVGHSRSGSTTASYRLSGSTGSATQASNSPNANNVAVFARDGGSVPTDARIAFYSIGESLDLAALDTRVTALITDIGNAI